MKFDIENTTSNLFFDIKQMIATARHKVAIKANSEIILLYWNVGNRIRKDVLNESRAEYGKQIVKKLSDKLTIEYGRGWGENQLRHCLRSAEIFPEEQILYALRRELSWTHVRSLMYIDNKLKRQFYLEMCIIERWDTRLLDDRIDSMLFERTAISKKPDELIKNELKQLSENKELTDDLVFRSPYFLNFLGLADTYSEKDLENAILSEIQRFIIELGSDFAFLSRQKRITIDNVDYHIDLLFYHRNLQRLVVIDLKLDKFKPKHKGQMELYLRWLEKYEKRKNEKTPIGLILCSEGSSEHVELLMLEGSNIKVAQYLTELPPKKILEKQLNKAIAKAREIEGKRNENN
ncbi:MAG: PDDEXK nuclease domain-containing protein [Bacteroidales bacterium]|nr:PDDEXK nuclease domain-containing protein [Bacteroidales bacterium]